jgi:hypothetical protein
LRSFFAVEGRTRASTPSAGMLTEPKGDGRGIDSWDSPMYLVGMSGTGGVPKAGLWTGVLGEWRRLEVLPPNFLRPVKEAALFSDRADAFSFSFLGHEVSCC